MANHGGDIYSETVAYDFSVNLSPLDCSGPHKDIIKAIEKKLANYPDVEQREFRKVVAEVENVKPKMIWGCNGASEALSAIVSMLKPKKSLLVDPCFGGYRHALSQVAGCNIESIRLNSANGFAVDAAIVDEIARAVTEVNNRIDLLIIANPNNPTGKVVPKECLEAIF